MSANQAIFPVSVMARVLGVSKAGFYAWLRRPASAHARADAALLKRIRTVHVTSRETYGAPRVHAELRAGGETHGRKRIARLMRDAGLVGAGRRRHGPITTRRDKEARPAPDLVDRDFTAAGPDRLWVADITFVPTSAGFLYLAVVLNAWSRRIVGWSMANHLRAELVIDALDMALGQRRPDGGVIVHSDQGSQGRFNRSSQHHGRGFAMGTGKRCSDKFGRAPLRSPGRPPVAGRDERQRFWALIASGLSSEGAAIGAGVPQAIGTRWFRKAGGMPPATFRRSAKPLSGRYLSLAEREEVAILRAQGTGIREMARQIGRSASTLSREVRRNAATRSGGLDYRAVAAQWHADRAARRPKPAKLATNAALRTYVQDRLAGLIITPGGIAVPGPTVSWNGRRHGPRKDRRWASAWSPEQIAHRLRLDFPHDETMRISPEAIYQSLYVQGRGALRRELVACLRTGRALRVPRARSRGRGKSFIVPEIMISERPAEVADRAVPGHWEGDLILGLESSAIGTLVERTTRFTMLLHLPRMAEHGLSAPVKNGPALAGHGAEAVRGEIARTISQLPDQLRRSLTWDQGVEMAQHARLTIATGLDVYFCDPHSPWQRGTNENTNGLLRQYFPKGTNLSAHGPDALDAVALALNTRPRKSLGWKTPAEAFDEHLRSVQMAVATTS